jgi:hypothetical protein
MWKQIYELFQCREFEHSMIRKLIYIDIDIDIAVAHEWNSRHFISILLYFFFINFWMEITLYLLFKGYLTIIILSNQL